MRSPFEGKPLHKVTVIAGGPGGSIIRVCVNCGASWRLGFHDQSSIRMSWMPIAEHDEYGKPLPHSEVDIRVCGFQEPEPERVTQQLAAVPAQPAKTDDPCWCPDCRGKKQHWPGDPRCICIKCKGLKTHKAAA